ncbi:TIGR00645 family protein [Zwartia panacis]|uniref:TIGR00645 family protein n=1 Tax=Zwartia panacis TaxID=2683345 RepID=UPI0025B5C6C3|nr:TIGR00645 family protein [Zwartia panacis]MDN4015714.1 TIGR00645 family protein [Zwartia panacis]
MKNSAPANPRNSLESLMFAARWLQLPLYFGLIIALGAYTYEFFIHLWELVELIIFKRTPDRYVILEVLDLVDIVMVANLLIMVIVGGYESFVSRLNLDDHPDQPEWLAHVNPGSLKVKLAISIVTIGAVHLLATFVNAAHIEMETILMQMAIQIVLMATAITIVVVDKLSLKSH